MNRINNQEPSEGTKFCALILLLAIASALCLYALMN